MSRVFIILFFLFVYTSFKAIQIVPEFPILVVGTVALIFVSVIGAMIASRSKPHSFDAIWFSLLSWLGTLAIGFFGTFLLISIPLDVLDLIFSLFNSGVGFMTSIGHKAVFVMSALMILIGLISVQLGPKIIRVDIPSTKLPDDLNGFTVAQISDLHIGPTIQSRYVERVVKRTNQQSPDIVVITGDLVDSHTESIKKHLRPLAQLKSKYGVYYVSGNHEYYWGIQALYPELEKVGIKILQNSNVVLKVNEAQLLIAGIPDPAGTSLGSSHTPDLKMARLTSASVDFAILLCHRPDPYAQAEALDFQVQFSGHTHAGQFFPFSLFISLAHKYYRGLNRIGKMWLYVNPGTGYWGPANRFGIASEITLAKLVKHES